MSPVITALSDLILLLSPAFLLPLFHSSCNCSGEIRQSHLEHRVEYVRRYRQSCQLHQASSPNSSRPKRTWASSLSGSQAVKYPPHFSHHPNPSSNIFRANPASTQLQPPSSPPVSSPPSPLNSATQSTTTASCTATKNTSSTRPKTPCTAG